MSLLVYGFRIKILGNHRKSHPSRKKATTCTSAVVVRADRRTISSDGSYEAVSARQEEGPVRGVHPLPARQAEKRVRGLQPLPAREGETQLRCVQPLSAREAERQLRGLQPLPPQG